MQLLDSDNSNNYFTVTSFPMNNNDNQVLSSSIDGTSSGSTSSGSNSTFLQNQHHQHSDADTQLLTQNASIGFDIANEIKRWQQLHQSNNGTAPTALLSSMGTNLQNQDVSTTAFLQQMIDSHQQQQRGTSNRFDIPLATSTTLSGNGFGQMMSNSNPTNDSMNGMNNDLFNTDSNNNSNNTNMNTNSNNNLQLPNDFYNNARLVMAQQAVAAMNFQSFANPMLLQQQQQQQQLHLPTQESMAATDLPLPSPHSLFHRDGTRRMRGGVIEPFPEKLHRLLIEVENAGRSDIISFVSSGRAFQIHKADKFFKDIVPLYFRQSRLSSFKRQLNLYGFELINTGPSRGGYFHELFIKDQPELCRRMRRVAVKVASKVDTNNKVEDEERGDNMTHEMPYRLDLHPSSSDIGRFDF